MATTDMVLHTPQLKNEDLADVQRLGTLLVASGYFADAREMAQAAVKVLAGRELGIPPIASMMGINIIKGKVALGAHLIASRVRAHGYDFRIVEHTTEGCVIEFLGRVDREGKRAKLGVASFNMKDAQTAGIMSDMYRKYPRNMYFSRAISNGVKWYCPEVFGGAPVYTPEELGAEVDQDGDVVHQERNHEELVEERIAEEQAKLEKQRAERKPAKASPQDEGTVHPEVEKMWVLMGTNIKDIVRTYAELKQAIVAAGGSERQYYEILGKHKMGHANDTGVPVQKHRVVTRELLELLQRMQQEPPPEAA